MSHLPPWYEVAALLQASSRWTRSTYFEFLPRDLCRIIAGLVIECAPHRVGSNGVVSAMLHPQWLRGTRFELLPLVITRDILEAARRHSEGGDRILATARDVGGRYHEIFIYLKSNRRPAVISRIDWDRSTPRIVKYEINVHEDTPNIDYHSPRFEEFPIPDIRTLIGLSPDGPAVAFNAGAAIIGPCDSERAYVHGCIYGISAAPNKYSLDVFGIESCLYVGLRSEPAVYLGYRDCGHILARFVIEDRDRIRIFTTSVDYIMRTLYVQGQIRMVAGVMLFQNEDIYNEGVFRFITPTTFMAVARMLNYRISRANARYLAINEWMSVATDSHCAAVLRPMLMAAAAKIAPAVIPVIGSDDGLFLQNCHCPISQYLVGADARPEAEPHISVSEFILRFPIFVSWLNWPTDSGYDDMF